jgi:hypothetical protein
MSQVKQLYDLSTAKRLTSEAIYFDESEYLDIGDLVEFLELNAPLINDFKRYTRHPNSPTLNSLYKFYRMPSSTIRENTAYFMIDCIPRYIGCSFPDERQIDVRICGEKITNISVVLKYPFKNFSISIAFEAENSHSICLPLYKYIVSIIGGINLCKNIFSDCFDLYFKKHGIFKGLVANKELVFLRHLHDFHLAYQSVQNQRYAEFENSIEHYLTEDQKKLRNERHAQWVKSIWGDSSIDGVDYLNLKIGRG